MIQPRLENYTTEKMFDTDFRRIDELFYRRVGKEQRVSDLKGIIITSFSDYAEKFLRTRRRAEAKQVMYSGEGNRSNLFLTIFTNNGGFPDLAGLRIRGRTNDLDYLLANLRGELTAEFSGYSLEDHDERRCSPDKDNSIMVGNLVLQLSQNPVKPKEVERAVLVKKALKKPALIEMTLMDENTLGVLRKAARISVLCSSYVDGFSTKDRIDEEATIINPGNGIFSLDYRIKTANAEGLPGDVLEPLERLFSIIKKDFSKGIISESKFGDVGSLQPSEEIKENEDEQ